MSRQLRVAWLGPMPAENGGVPYIAAEVLAGLPDHDVAVDAYFAGPHEAVPPGLRGIDGLSLFPHDDGWRYGRWYSSHAMTKLLSGQATRIATQQKLLRTLAAEHERQPYDALYQFSQFEPPGLRRVDGRLPPLVVHPETHAAGELRSHFRERRLSAEAGESAAKRALVLSMFAARTGVQRVTSGHIARIIAPSENFARHLRTDYSFPAERITVIPNPIDLHRFQPGGPDGQPPVRRIVIAGRVSARKGVELIVELGRAIADLQGTVELVVVGGWSLWSDYRPLLRGLDPRMGRYVEAVSGPDMAGLFRSAEMVVQPSHYEPFALTVGEALACGTPVVVSDEVGAGEHVDPACCRRFVTGSATGLEAAVRDLLGALDERREEIRSTARAEAERLFAPSTVVGAVADVLRGAAT